MNRRQFVLSSAAIPAALSAGALLPLRVAAQSANPAAGALATNSFTATGAQDRTYWLTVVNRIARPVLTALAARQLKATWTIASGGREDRSRYAPLEALGRLLTGLAPWLENTNVTGPEAALRSEFADMARKAIDAGTDPASPDYMNFTTQGQPVVDAAFLAHALLRAPNELWQKLDPAVQKNVTTALAKTRATKPPQTNWLLFSAMVEVLLYKAKEKWLPEPIETALTKHESWYRGDGIYGDGPSFHFDYYNSYVIQPMLIDVIENMSGEKPEWAAMKTKVQSRSARYAAIQERLISPEGTFPAVGRSLVYRFGAFQLLGQIALRKELPKPIVPAQVRCALTAVIRRMIEAPGTFDDKGFLTIGFVGKQPGIAEPYISTGSLYLCSAGLLPLGLGADDAFWSAPAAEWTQKKTWAGEDVAADHALGD